LAFTPNEKSFTTHHAEENNMASPTQIVVGKGIPNMLIAEDLLKILRELTTIIFTKILYQFPSMDGRTINYILFSSEMIIDLPYHVNIILLTVKLQDIPYGSNSTC